MHQYTPKGESAPRLTSIFSLTNGLDKLVKIALFYALWPSRTHRVKTWFTIDRLKLCSLTEVCFDKALQRARELDRYFAENGTPVGPLHGIPMTLKDQFDVKGWDTTLGYIGRAGIPAADDAVLVQMLQFLGAIIVAKTNLPQSIMVSFVRFFFPHLNHISSCCKRRSVSYYCTYSGVRLKIRSGV